MAWLYDLGSAVLGAVVAHPVVAALLGGGLAVAIAALAQRAGLTARARRQPRRTAAILIAILAVVAPLGWYLTSPLVLSASIDEPAPIVGSPAPASSATPTTQPTGSAPGRPTATPTAAPTGTPTVPPLARSGPFHGSDDFHFGRGTARLIETAPGSYVVRLEDFAVRNGPDLYVYLSPSADGYTADAIELGKLKADTGNQNYPVPAGSLADPARAASVVIWCKQFTHLFATAPLTD